jgi:hypothetical protein
MVKEQQDQYCRGLDEMMAMAMAMVMRLLQGSRRECVIRRRR